MIQRPQTLFLLLAALLNLAVFFNPVYSKAMQDPVIWIGFGLAGTLTLVMLIALAAIFLHKNRIFQLKVVKLATYIQIVALGFALGVIFSLGNIGTHLWREAAGTGLILLVLIFLWLAGRGIKKDDELVKSIDRIR